MQEGIKPAIVSVFFPGVGQALTDGKPTGKWIVIWLIYVVIYNIIRLGVDGSIATIFAVIVWLILVIDAYKGFINI